MVWDHEFAEPQAAQMLALLMLRQRLLIPETMRASTINGPKIYITGDHNLAKNIVHLVLARLLTLRKDLEVFLSLSCPSII